MRMGGVVHHRYHSLMSDLEPTETHAPLTAERPVIDPAGTTDQLVRLAALAYAEPGGPRLTATQWMVLRYFARANRFSRTVSAFAEYHASTRGTASQTIKGLVQRGYLERTRSETDGRSVRHDLTPRGWAVLAAADPCTRLDAVIGALPPDQVASLERGISTLTRMLSGALRRPQFGRCRLCRYFMELSPAAGDQPAAGTCSRLDTDIHAEDLAAGLCMSHSAV